MAKKRNGLFDLLKIFGTLAIVLHHYQQLTGAHWNGLNFWGDEHFYFGYLVELFFMISGIVVYPHIISIREGETFSDFFWKKYFRYLPATFLSVYVTEALLLWFQISTGSEYGEGVNLGAALIAALNLQSFAYVKLSINNPLWFISALLLCYIVFYLIVKLSTVVRGMKVSYLFIILVILGGTMVSNDWRGVFFNRNIGRGFYAFFWGLLFSQILANWKSKSRYLISGLIALIVTLLMALCPNIIKTGEIRWLGANMILLYIFYPSLILLLDNSVVRRILDLKVFKTLAGISVGAFVWHSVVHLAFFLIMIVSETFCDVSDPIIVSVIIFMDYIVGTFSYFVLEKPFMRYLSKKNIYNILENDFL